MVNLVLLAHFANRIAGVCGVCKHNVRVEAIARIVPNNLVEYSYF